MKKVLFLGAICALTTAGAWPPARPAFDKRYSDNGLRPCPVPCDFEAGDEPLPCKSSCSPTYNIPAGIHLTGRDRCVNFFVGGSYLYWYANQQGMELAKTLQNVGGINYPAQSGEFISQPFHYTSGFRAKMGLDFPQDDWVLDAQYTYLRPHSRLSDNLSTTGNLRYNFLNWFTQIGLLGQSCLAFNVLSKWRLGLDWLDLTASRAFYQARRGVVIPFGGLRASWIRQSLVLTLNNVVNPNGGFFPALTSTNRSYSWGIGPRAGMEGRWILPWGMRVQGAFGGSLLFTQFTKIAHKETTFPGFGPTYNPTYTMHNYNCLRPMVEAGLGLGWGRYFSDQRYHFDFSATYDFNYLWEQNMIRYQNDFLSIGTSASANALYFHGLTINARFDF